MRKVALALAVAASVIAVNKPEPANAQFWMWVGRAAIGTIAGYGAYSAYNRWRYGPPSYGYGPGPGYYAYNGPRYRCSPRDRYFGYC